MTSGPMGRWSDTLPVKATRLRRLLGRLVRLGIRALGILMLLMIVLAFTRIPFDAHRWLGTAGGLCAAGVGTIVVLGGSGMPSGPELLRLHYAAEFAALQPAAQVLVVHPQDGSVMDAMVAELLLRGVDESRISRILEGTNTREQVLRIAAARPEIRGMPVAVVTAPANMYRSLLAFRRAGFTDVCGVPAFDHALFVDLRYGHQAIGGKAYVPDVSGSQGLRYDLWNRLKLQITCLRECLAIAYYRLNGWI
jgi:uncharacterized SAM-binding protein YcdF (DUF218 family)